MLGFPSNQFLQELSSSEAIKEFCSTTYGVTFPMFEKIRVNGRSQHPLYAELTRTADAEGKASRVKWNFEKFVVTPAGEVHRFRESRAGCPRDPRSDRGLPARSQLTTERVVGGQTNRALSSGSTGEALPCGPTRAHLPMSAQSATRHVVAGGRCTSGLMRRASTCCLRRK